ncbi:MAG: type II toxin-antitoxin system PemK/MazF family toxin [Clostridiales bacterium]|nr:type II toxin-antitoxin system PemK/MazF family toxin [Clostridiales bacterium]
MLDISQGDVLKVEKQTFPVLIVSKNFFNRSERVMACPIRQTTDTDPLHIYIETDDISGTVMCEQVKLLDLHFRGYKKTGELPLDLIMNITDAIQGIFDYYPYN